MKKLLLVISISIIIFPSLATSENISISNEFLPLPPRATFWGFAGEHQLGQAEAILPIYGNQNALFYFDAQGKTTFSSDWLASFGLGARRIINDQRILGAYMFLDSNTSTTNNQYWFVNPGVESLGQIWDFRANAYIPISTQQKYIGTDFADNFNNDDYIQFHGHTQWDAILQEYESTGSGVDAEIGRTVPKLPGLRVYFGGYHATSENMSAMNGVSARLEYPLTAHLGLSLRDSYDNLQHNSVLLGLNLTLGGVDKSPHDQYQAIQNRLLDPIERHLATQAQATGEPINTRQQVFASSVVEKDNIWFFQPIGGSSFQDASSCTAENPCSDFDQNTIDGINQIAAQSPNFYFQPGQYSSLTLTSDQTATPLILSDDELFGRSVDYRRPQQSAEFMGAMTLRNADSLNAIILYNDPAYSQKTALILDPDSTVVLDQVKIGENNNTQGYVNGIEMTDSTLYVRDNSQINAFSNTSRPAIGIDAGGQTAAIYLDKSQINVHSGGKNNNVNAIGINARASANNNIQLMNSSIKVDANAVGNLKAGEVSATGIAMLGNNNTVQLAGNSAVNVDVAGTNIEKGSSVGISASNGDAVAGTNTITMQDNSQINVEAQAGLGYYWAVNSFGVTGISATTGSQGENIISLRGNSQINSNITDGVSGGIGDLLTVRGISAYGGSGSSNIISLENNSTVQAALDYDGRRSFSGNVCGICAFAANNQITLSGNSMIAASAYISPVSGWHNEVSDYGILASGKTNNIGLSNKAAISVTANVEGGSGNVVYLDGISAQGDNTIHMSGNSSVKAMSTINNDGIENFNFVSGISANGNNNIVLQDKASVQAAGITQDTNGFNDVKVQGINLDGRSWVNISKNSMITALASADGKSPYAQAFGINSWWSQSEIIDADATMANITATAIAPEGEAVARKINPRRPSVNNLLS